MLLVYGLTVVLLRVVFAKLPDRVPQLQLATMALALSGIGLLVAAAVAEPLALFVAAVLMAAGVAFLTPALFGYLFARVDAAQRGSALGTASLFLDLAFGAGPLVLGLVAAASGIQAAFVAGAGIALIGALGTAAGARRARAPVVEVHGG